MVRDKSLNIKPHPSWNYMALRSEDSRIDKYRKFLILISIIILFAGVNVAILISKWSRLLGVVLAIIGGVMLYFFTRTTEKTAARRTGFPLPRGDERKIAIIAERAVYVYTFKGRFPRLMPITGVIIAGGVLFYNLYLRFNTYLGSNDIVVLLLAASIISYNYIPKKYSVERDFVLIFFFLLFVIVVIPTTYYSLKYGTTGGSLEDQNPDSPIIHYFLVRPLVLILRLFDIHAVAEGVTIEFPNVHHNERIEISIALGCTGLYSTSIFLSAFTSYILVEYRMFDKKVLFLLILGIITSYIANLLRMTIIALVGYYYGMEALIWTHKNIGELIFMFWIGIFWGLMFKYLDIELPWKQES